MALLHEFAITPDVFDVTAYSSEEVADLRIQGLREILVEQGLVRDLCQGKWSEQFKSTERIWVKRTKEVLKKLLKQGRLYQFPSQRPDFPVSDLDWCAEALETHKMKNLNGVITSSSTASGFQNPLVCAIERLNTSSWWSERSPSVRLCRSKDRYAAALDPLLRAANSLMFIDPHLDPTQQRYKSFIDLLCESDCKCTRPVIEVHRVCYFNTLNKLNQKNNRGWQQMFSGWEQPLRNANLTVEIFIWDDFHDRYLISNLMGITMPNGFDTTANPSDITTWTRMGRTEADDVQREFDPAASRHHCHHRFQIGAV